MVVAAAAATLTAACDQSPTAVPVSNEFELAAVVVPTGTVFNVVVCKEGPAGFTYDFGITAVTTDVTLPHGNTFSLGADECTTVATATDNLQSVTIDELTPPAGTLFDEVDVYRFTTAQPTPGQSLNRTEQDPSVTLGSFGEDVGWVLVFKNIAEPPPPPAGCTLTQGYWKTHSEHGPAPYDNTWDMLANGADTPFFTTGQTWYEVFHTPVAGNQYYNLAHQYMAAVLNGLAGASAPQAVLDAITAAETLLANDPAVIGALKGNNALRKEFVAAAGTLGSYNEGLIGPGHCED
jgi:hypothetical protein